MRWVIVAVLILTVIIVICLVIKAVLRCKLRNIDGFYGVHAEDLTKNGETIIGHFGDDK